jgi:hypothetical protein
VATRLEDLEATLASHPDRVLVIAGAGVAMATHPGHPCAGRSGLLRHGVRWCRDRCPTLDPSLLASYEGLLAAGELLHVATFIAQRLRSVREGEYAAWLTESVGQLQVVDDRLIRALLGWGCQIATTNYDTLVERVSGRASITWMDHALALEFLLGDSTDVLHLHGQYQRPETVVLDARSYGEVCLDESAQNGLRVALTARTVVFVGYGAGLDDPNFGHLLAWSRQAVQHSMRTHYRLVREPELKQAVQECQGLSIQPISYGGEYADLAPFLAALGERAQRRRQPRDALQQLTRGQDDYRSCAEELRRQRAALSPADYVRRRLALARELWRVGGRRTAALDMNGVFTHEAANLDPGERVPLGLDVAEMLLDDELERMAASILEQVLPDLEISGIPAGVLARFRQLHLRCLTDLCAYRETLEAIARALPHAWGEERQRLEVQRAEVHLLQGELGEALNGLDDEGVL